MVEKLVEKLNETSEKGIGKTRRNFLKYLASGIIAGGLAVGGLGYLGYESFREPTLRKKIEAALSNEARAKLLVKASYKTPNEVKKLFVSEKVRSEYENFDIANVSKEDLISCENSYKALGLIIDFPNEGKFSEGDKLTYFLYKDISRAAGEAFAGN